MGHTYIPWYIHTYTYIPTYIHTYMCTYIHTYIHTVVHSYIQTHILQTYLHTYIICTHTYMHAYIRTCRSHSRCRVAPRSHARTCRPAGLLHSTRDHARRVVIDAVSAMQRRLQVSEGVARYWNKEAHAVDVDLLAFSLPTVLTNSVAVHQQPICFRTSLHRPPTGSWLRQKRSGNCR
jgi:hypothetical protein